jgi:small subunit ribosomal protein S9
MAETTVDIDLEGGETPSSYTSETAAPAGRGQSLTAPGQALGRRKEAIARVRLVPGTGQWKINGRTLEEYFPNKVHQQLVNSPLKLVEVEGRFDVIARISGGGVTGQAGALRLGIARALNEIDAEHNRPALKKAGFLTRDARVVERKKAGLKKARKAPQYSKRSPPEQRPRRWARWGRPGAHRPFRCPGCARRRARPGTMLEAAAAARRRGGPRWDDCSAPTGCAAWRTGT